MSARTHERHTHVRLFLCRPIPFRRFVQILCFFGCAQFWLGVIFLLLRKG
jgi:hypothetical protein